MTQWIIIISVLLVVGIVLAVVGSNLRNESKMLSERYLSVAELDSTQITAAYGEKVVASPGKPIRFPDFILRYTGYDSIQGPNHAPWYITHYLFSISDEKVDSMEVSWSSGTGVVQPNSFEFAGKTYTIEKTSSAKPDGLAEDEVVIVISPKNNY